MADKQFKAECKAAFDFFDNDKSGSIDSTEFAQLGALVGVKLSQEELTAAFASLDTNQDGTLSFPEFWEWWNSQGSAAGSAKATEVRSRLLVAKGHAYLAQKYANTVKASADALAKQTKIILRGKVDEPKMGISVRITTDAKAEEAYFAAHPEMTAVATFDLDLVAPESAKYATAVVKMLFAGAVASDGTGLFGGDGVKLETAVVKDGLGLRVFVGTSASAMALDMLSFVEGFGASLFFGWSPQSLAAKGEAITIPELLNIEISAALAVLPFPASMFIEKIKGSLGELLPADKIDSIPGVADLNNGKLDTTVDLSALVDEMLAMSPVPVASGPEEPPTTLSSVLQGLAPMVIEGKNINSFKTFVRSFAASAECIDLFATRDVKAVTQFGLRTKAGLGVTLDLINLVSTGALGCVLKAAQGTLEAIAADLPDWVEPEEDAGNEGDEGDDAAFDWQQWAETAAGEGGDDENVDENAEVDEE